MESEEVLRKMTELKSVYGVGARMYLNDSVSAHNFICEFYKEFDQRIELIKKKFGGDLAEIIKLYVEEHPC